jgi:hypothetical protein
MPMRRRAEPKKKQPKTKMPKRRMSDAPLPKQKMPGFDARNRRINNLKRMKGPRKIGPRRLTGKQ